MSQQPNLSDLGLTENDIDDIMNEVGEVDEILEDDREERGSLVKMTEFSRNLLNSSGNKDKTIEDDIDLDKLLSSGLKSEQEMNESESNQNCVIGSTISQMSLGAINSSILGNKNSQINMDSSIKFESKINEDELTDTKQAEDTLKPNQNQPTETDKPDQTIQKNTEENIQDSKNNKNDLDIIHEEKLQDKMSSENDSKNKCDNKMDFIDMKISQSEIKLKNKESNDKKNDIESTTSNQV